MRNFTTRKPTGKPSFPMILLAGIEGSGKTWSAVEATASDDVGRAFFIEIGESMADEYGAVPGADFEIIEHDGTIQQIREAVMWASQQPVEDGKYNLLIMDSMSEVWTLLSDNAQQEANQRARRKAEKARRRLPEDDVTIGMDLWNAATNVWNGLITQCRNFPGPVLMTARLEMVTLMDNNGQPSKDKDWKVKSQKSLPYNVQVVMQAREPRRWTMTKVATTAESLQLPPGKDRTMPNFTVTSLLEKMGITPDSEQTTYVKPQTDGSLGEGQGQQAPPQQQKPYWWSERDQRPREKFVSDFADNLMQAEKSGDAGKINQLGAYVEKHGDGQLVSMAQQTLGRMAKNAQQESSPSPEEARETAQEVLDAEVVTEERVAA